MAAERMPVIRLSSLAGRPVRDAESGRQIGRVKHVVVDLSQAKLMGFRFRSGGLLDRRWRFLALGDVQAIDPHAIVMANANALREDVRSDTDVMLGSRLKVVDAASSQSGRLADGDVEMDSGRLIAFFIKYHGAKSTSLHLPGGVTVCRGGEVELHGEPLQAATPCSGEHANGERAVPARTSHILKEKVHAHDAAAPHV